MARRVFPHVVLMDVAADGVYQLGAANDWLHAGGIIGLVVAGAVGYAAIAFELKGLTRRTILPTFERRGFDPAVAHLDPALDGLLHEAGGRRGS